MKRYATTAGLLTTAATLLFAANSYKAKPGVFDPDNTGIVSAAWVAQIGLPDAGNSNHGLYLAKDGPTSAFAAAGAAIEGVEGVEMPLGFHFGFDYKNGGHCSGGAPRFNLQASDGFHFLGGCANGTQTPVPGAPGWTRVRIDPFNPAQAFPVVTPGATIVSLTLIFDEGTDTPVAGAGSVIVDNIDVNGTLIGKPGNAK
jgi:hypothetical protein